jgi:hypothetical protein
MHQPNLPTSNPSSFLSYTSGQSFFPDGTGLSGILAILSANANPAANSVPSGCKLLLRANECSLTTSSTLA